MAQSASVVPEPRSAYFDSRRFLQFSDFKEAVVQAVVRIFFVSLNILMAASASPSRFHWVAIPLVGSSSAILAGFFFPDRAQMKKPLFSPLNPLIHPVQMPASGDLPVDYPRNAPRGYFREGQNCALNSAAHILDSIPSIAQWLRNPITDEADLPSFLNRLAEYSPPRDLVAAFMTFVDQEPFPHPPVWKMFYRFIVRYEPPADEAADCGRIRELFPNLMIVQRNFAEFFKSNDQAVELGEMVSRGQSQRLRRALSRVSPFIDPSSSVQVDAAEVLRLVLDLLPDSLKAFIETRRRIRVEGVPPIAQPPAPNRERVPFLTLALDPKRPRRSLLELLHDHSNNSLHEPARYRGVDGRMREYPVEMETVEFLEPPPALLIHLKRFSSERPESFWKRAFPLFATTLPWRSVKVDIPVDIPERISIRVQGGRFCEYRLVSFVNHHGQDNAGHYTSSQIVDGHRFLMNDANVTLEDPAHPERWNERLSRAYFLCYVPV